MVIGQGFADRHLTSEEISRTVHEGLGTLAVDGKLLGEISASIGIRHGSGGQQEQFAEITLVERQAGNLFA